MTLRRKLSLREITADMPEWDSIRRAREFAIRAHGDQRYGDKPYVDHLDAVADMVREYGGTAIVVAYLHDLVEDTEIHIEEIETLFVEYVAIGVISLLLGSTYREALIVKAADRACKIQKCVETGNHRLLKMYRQEHEAFRAAVYRKGLCDELWEIADRAVREEEV